MSDSQLITSLQHPLVKHLVKLRMDNSYRYEQQALVMEGIKPIQEVISWITKIFYLPSCLSLANRFSCKKWEITESVLEKISGMRSPEGLVAEIKMPAFVSLDKAEQVLALDGISDPGNLGTLLRTALAFGWKFIYFLPNCCDPFNEKVLSSARGAHFKLNLIKGTDENLLQWAQKNQIQSLVADLQGQKPETVPLAPHRLLVLGNEAHGATENIRNFCHPVTIPMIDAMESLNVAVAGGILLYYFSNGITK